MNIGQDIRFTLRTMRKSPAFTAVAVVTLALGIGANTAIFTVVNAVFFNPIPVNDPKTLVSLFTTDQRNKTALQNFLPISYPNADDIRRQAQSLSGVVISAGTPVSMTINGQPDQYNANVVTGNYFDLLDRKSTRLNSSRQIISYAVFCLKKKKKKNIKLSSRLLYTT